MNSPFPGMDPYLESTRGLWEGFHGHLIEEIYRAIATVLPRRYTVDTATRSYVVLVEAEGKKDPLAKPDVVVHEPRRPKSPRKKTNGVALAEPDLLASSVRMQAFVAEEFEEKFIEIYLEDEKRVLVACIEVLSPSNNQPGTKGWKEYMRKRQAMFLGRANLVEIDLLRGGQKFPMLTPWPDSPYSLLVSWSDDAPYCRVWPARYRDRLPAIPVPLVEPDPDLTLDLQPLIDGIYSLGRYAERIDYDRPLTPALPDADAAWLRQQIKGRARPRRKR
ncbi:MAG: DUF4058 family protein [Gemmataceae bacterium]